MAYVFLKKKNQGDGFPFELAVNAARFTAYQSATGRNLSPATLQDVCVLKQASFFIRSRYDPEMWALSDVQPLQILPKGFFSM